MNQELILHLARETLQVTLMVSGPLLLVSLVIGILGSTIGLLGLGFRSRLYPGRLQYSWHAWFCSRGS